MAKLQQTRRPHLFVLRVWLEELDESKQEWRGDIEHVTTREKRYFREWQVLLNFVQRSCEQAQRQSEYVDDFPLRDEKKQ